MFNFPGLFPEGGSNSSWPIDASYGTIKTGTAPAMPDSGINPMSMATILASMGKAFAPYKTDRWGHKIPSWQEGVADSVGQMSRAQMIMQALSKSSSTGGTAGMNPLLLAMFMGGGK